MTLGYEAQTAFPYEGTMYLVGEAGGIEPFVPRADSEARAQAPS